jgi:hypothetical protein
MTVNQPGILIRNARILTMAPAELAASQRVRPRIHLGTPRPARQLPYVTGRLAEPIAEQQTGSVHELVRNRR